MLKTIDIKVVKDPQITAKMLCEYNEASALARLNILKSCKVKNPAVIAISKRYGDARDLIIGCLQHSFEFMEVLKVYAGDLRKKSRTVTGKSSENLILCAEALEKFYAMDDLLTKRFNHMSMRNAGSIKGKKLLINGVIVSARPEILLSNDSGLSTHGFIKLCFNKTKPLNDSIGQGIASLSRRYFKEVEGLDLLPEDCIVIDVFANKVFCAPKRDKRIIDGLSACCAEIADRWEKITL